MKCTKSKFGGDILDKNNILIRKVKTSDAEQYIRLKNLVWRDAYKEIFPEEVFDEMDNKVEEKVKTFSTNYYNDNTKICYVAELDGNIVGLMYGTIKSMYEHFAKEGYADLVALYIKPEYQRCGIATKFKEIFKGWAKENGADKFVIGVLKENKKARNIYEKWGGKLDMHEQEFVKLNKGYDEIFYTYDL